MSTRNEKIATINRLIPDENLRHVIFNFEDEDDIFLSDDKGCLTYFSNIMTFSMLLVWNAFLAWKKGINDKEIDGNNSFWRIYNMLDKACDPTKISGEFVDDLLINLEIDCLLDTETSQSFVESSESVIFSSSPIRITSFRNISIWSSKGGCPPEALPRASVLRSCVNASVSSPICEIQSFTCLPWGLSTTEKSNPVC